MDGSHNLQTSEHFVKFQITPHALTHEGWFETSQIACHKPFASTVLAQIWQKFFLQNQKWQELMFYKYTACRLKFQLLACVHVMRLWRWGDDEVVVRWRLLGLVLFHPLEQGLWVARRVVSGKTEKNTINSLWTGGAIWRQDILVNIDSGTLVLRM